MDPSTQKRFGSYYTGADITEYISAASIPPCLFASAERQCPAAFAPDGPIWSLLRAEPDRYIYRALKHGCALALPPEIAEGLRDVSLRGTWKRPALTAYALPLETWREVVARRQRYTELRARLRAGEICRIDDLITCNLDIRRFASEVIERCSDAGLLDSLYTCLEHLSILDPTCGAGAFLLAALRDMEPLYAACLERMQRFLDEQSCYHETAQALSRHQLERFRGVLQEMGEYPISRKAIHTAIIRHNLYGVDIMPEAIERCKQALLQTLASSEQTEDERDADIEAALTSHLRTGNALVGFTASPFPALPATSRRAELDAARATVYSVDCKQAEDTYVEQLPAWRAGQRPFHWCAEFQEIINGGGFDVIIGNPPYVACKKESFQAQEYATQACGNLYAYTLERALTLLRPGGRCGMIVPVSAISGERFRPLNQLLLRQRAWVSSYSNRPARLFAGVEQRLTILLISNAQPPALFSSPYQHWYRAERAHLFDTLSYTPASAWSHTGMPLKSGSVLAESIFSRLLHQTGMPLLECQRAAAAVWIHNGPTYWVRALPFEPNAGCKGARSNHYRRIPVKSQRDAYILAAVLSSSTFYLFYKLVSNCRDLGRKELSHFPLGHVRPELSDRLASLGRSLALRLQETMARCKRRYASGVILYEEYYPARAKNLLDQIDSVLAEHYGFTAEELDYILNYTIKYRMGSEEKFAVM